MPFAFLILSAALLGQPTLAPTGTEGAPDPTVRPGAPDESPFDGFGEAHEADEEPPEATPAQSGSRWRSRVQGGALSGADAPIGYSGGEQRGTDGVIRLGQPSGSTVVYMASPEESDIDDGDVPPERERCERTESVTHDPATGETVARQGVSCFSGDPAAREELRRLREGLTVP